MMDVDGYVANNLVPKVLHERIQHRCIVSSVSETTFFLSLFPVIRLKNCKAFDPEPVQAQGRQKYEHCLIDLDSLARTFLLCMNVAPFMN